MRIIIHCLSARRDVGFTQGSSHLTKHSSPARGKKLSSSKELAWNLYTVSHKVLENTKQANSSSLSTYFMLSVTDENLLTHAEM